MKAPEKIYLQACGSCDIESECNDCQWKDLVDNVTWCEDRIFKRDIEYVRKDALLEWAKEELSKASVSSNSIGRRNAFIDIIDKLNSM